MAPPADLALGAFSDDPPWEIDPGALRWNVGLDGIRRRTHDLVPELTRPSRLPPGRRAVKVVRHLATALGGWRLLDRRRFGPGSSESTAGLARRAREAFEALGPTYIKLGQILSSGEGIFPPEVVAEFRKCRDQVPPERFDDVRRVIEEELRRPIPAVFEWIDEQPLAAASIAQVHAARLVTGEAVVVKVQRPRVRERVHADLRVMAWIAPHMVGRIPIAALANPPALVELFAETITEELDFRLEAENMLDIARVLVATGQRGWVIPRPHPELVTRRVLVMERLDGFAFHDVAGMRDAGIDTEAIVRTGMIAFLEGAMLHGIFHGDLHGGNLFVMADGRTALLDFGITGRLGEDRRLAMLRLLMAATTNDLDGQLHALRDLGALPADTDFEALIRDLGLDRPTIDPTTLTGEELVKEIGEVIKALLAYGARMPKELMLFVKDMVFLDGAIATLAPDLDLFGEIGAIAMHFATAHGDRIMREVGVDPRQVEVDLTGVKASFGVTEEQEQLTYRELQKRREIIRQRLGDVRR